MSSQQNLHHYPQIEITDKSHENFDKKIKKLSKELKIEILTGLIDLKFKKKKDKKNLFEISDFDNFEHISDLIEEEFEDLLREKKIYKSRYLNKIEEITEIRSVYKNYKWILFSSKKFIFIAFIKKEINNLQIERNFIKLSDFLENLKFSKISLSKIKRKKIENHLENLFLKQKAISKLEQNTEKFEISNFEEKFRNRTNSVKLMMLPLNDNEIVIKRNFENLDKKFFFFNKSIFFSLLILAAFFTLWFVSFGQNTEKRDLKDVHEGIFDINNII